MIRWPGKSKHLNQDYRSDIQSLRAIAVLGVVGFHAGLNIQSGYIGVDLFFVISGYVITGVIYNQYLGAQGLKLRTFYLNRVYRLLPSLGTMILTVSLMSILLFSPLGMLQNSAKTGIGALLISGNWIISKVTEGYFDLPAETNPFLNTWSLSVEEQFYIFFPAFFVFVFLSLKRISKLNTLNVIWMLLTISSFAIYVYSPSLPITGSFSWLTGFYSPVTRAWEFLLGVLFQMFTQRKSKNLSEHSSGKLSYLLTGLIAICLLAPADLFRFPSPYLAYPLMMISFLLVTDNGRNRILHSGILKYIGDRSYSIYLWHWPFIVIAKYLFPEQFYIHIMFVLLSFFVAILIFKYVENPLRLVVVKNRANTLYLLVIFLLLPIITSAGVGYISSNVLFDKYQSGSIQGNYPGDVGAIGFESFSTTYKPTCLISWKDPSREIRNCKAGLLLVGDSHAGHLAPGFSRNLPSVGVFAIDSSIYDSKDISLKSNLISSINNNRRIKWVIFNSYWAKNGVSPNLRASIASMTSHGKKVTVLDDVPNFPFDAFTCKYGMSVFIKHSNCTSNSRHFNQQRKKYFPDLQKAISGLDNVELITTSSEYCNANKCSMLLGNELHYLDLNHLNSLGSTHLSKYVINHSNFLSQMLTQN